jgi:hypothetical protein
MKNRASLWLLRLMPVVFATVALADPGGAAMAPGPVPGAAPGLPMPSPAESLTLSKDMLTKMRDRLTRVKKLLAEARQQKDIIKINCVTDKMVQIQGHISVAEKSTEGLGEAVTRQDTAESEHQFSRVSIVHEKVLGLAAEAENCVGEDMNFVGEQRSELTIDPSIPPEDPTETRVPEPVVPPRPTEASPTV